MPKIPRSLAAVDAVSQGEVTKALQEWSAARVSYAAMGRLLKLRFGFTINPETVRRWLHALEANGEAA